MNPELTAALYGGLAGGVVGGTLGIVGIFLGLFAERYLQRRGKLRCVPDGWQLTFRGPDGEGGIGLVERYASTSARYSFGVKFFNEKDVDTGLRDLHVEFRWKDGRTTTVRPWNSAATRVQGGITTSERVEVLNLPSREWHSMSLHGTIDGEEARNIPECRRVMLVGHFPTGRTFEKQIPTPETGAQSWFRRIFGQ
jgi:hypothetical protein